MFIEDLRENDLFNTSVWSNKIPEETKLPLTYIGVSNNAFYATLEDIVKLEDSKSTINNGLYSQSAVSMWFLSIEAYISSLLRIACVANQKDFLQYKNFDLGRRISELFRLLKKDIRYFNKFVFPKLNEFMCYRNELFHDRVKYGDLKLNLTSFSQNPWASNQVDVLQALEIALDVFNSLRHIINGVDLMPQVLINRGESFFYISLDKICVNVLYPFFYEILEKHKLETNLKLRPACIFYLDCKIFDFYKFIVVTKMDVQDNLKHKANDEYTTLGRDRFVAYVDNFLPTEKGLYMAKYNIG